MRGATFGCSPSSIILRELSAINCTPEGALARRAVRGKVSRLRFDWLRIGGFRKMTLDTGVGLIG